MKKRVAIVLIISVIVLVGVLVYCLFRTQVKKEQIAQKETSSKQEDIVQDEVFCDDIELPANAIQMANESLTTSNNQSGVIVTKDTFGSDNSIYRIEIGYDVTEIEDGSFSNLKNLKEISVDARNPYYASKNGCLYNKDFSELLCVPQDTSSVQIVASIKGYSPHAVDGLEQSRVDKLNSVIDGNE